jgi:hypothetical protein
MIMKRPVVPFDVYQRQVTILKIASRGFPVGVVKIGVLACVERDNKLLPLALRAEFLPEGSAFCVPAVIRV